MGVFVAGTGFNQPVGLSVLPIFNGFWLIRWHDK
jgi:hypothetical protein